MLQKVLAIVGPTASKKSRLALRLIRDLKLNSELISADAFQIYKELNVGTNKPSDQQLQQVKHHFINHCDINEKWSIYRFQNEAKPLLKVIHDQGQLPVVCGNSHLYVDALLKDYHLEKKDMRSDLSEQNYATWTNQALYDKLTLLDSKEALKINVNNRRRLIKAITICELNNVPKSSLDVQTTFKYNTLMIVCMPPRVLLYEWLNIRTMQMYENGWVDEIRSLLKKYPNLMHTQAIKATGYYYLASCLVQKQTIDLEYLKQLPRNLAKRQISWCKSRYFNQAIVYDETKDSYDELKQKVANFSKAN